ncbi:hypothetical protein BDD12DRAFT_727055 [Trichophaea hybrida]|nr:hypothetical protein BDD12DRAFT_727055 [Trichophaea hybrida]
MSVGVRLTTKLSESSNAAPTTTITPPTPTDSASHFPPKSPVGAILNATNGRKSRTDSLSNAPSKLSQSMTNEGATSSSDSPNPTGGGFFQSMFSAAHNAATSLTNNIPLNLANNPNSRARSTTVDSADTTKSSTEPLGDVSSPSDEQQREREPAVKTLGMGELNLATLGIVPDPVATTQADGTNVVSARGNGSRDDIGLREHNKRYSAPQTPAYSGFDTAGESPSRGTTPYAEDVPFRGNSNTSAGDLTPDRNSLIEQVDEDDGTDGDPKRSGSVRSGGGTAATAKRHRGSSAASQGTLLLPTPRATGFAVANTKRNRDFHNLFKSVPEEDYLIEDYGCALQREILLQGRLYVSERHICFYSNILGWVTTLVISFDEVMSVEKKSTALLFPNAIVIQTLHARHVFASFISRDSTYDLIVGLWNVGGSQVVNGNGEAHLDGAPSGGDSGEEDGDEYMDESEDDGESFMDAGDGPLEDNDNTSVPVALKNPSRKPSQLPISNGAATGGSTDGGNSAVGDFPGPKTHSPTVCGDDDKHYDKNLCDEILPVPLGQIYSLIFGAASHPFLTQLLTEEEKVLELQIPNNGEWIDQDGKKTRTFSYVKPLPGTIGPSKTRCIITETIDHYDLEDHISVTVSTQTPDVPSGGVFSVKTRYCLMWAEGCSTRLISNCAVEWTGKSWIKAPIEKGANDGQVGYNKVLLTCLRREIAPKRAGGRSGKGKGKRRNAGTGGAGRTAREAGGATSVTPTPSPDSWGFLEPLKPIFGPIVDIFGPLLPANFTVIVVTVLITLFLSGMIRPATNQGEIMRGNIPRYLGAQRYWEDGWMGAEEGLWEWLEDRAGIDAIPSLQQKEGRRKSFEKKVVKAAGSVMKNRQVQEAISVLKERLASLERIVDEKKKLGEREEEKEKVEKGNTKPTLEL